VRDFHSTLCCTKAHSRTRAENVIELDVDISNEAINVLVENGLAQRHAQICLQWKDDLRTASRERDQFIAEQEATAKQAIWYELPIIERAIEAAVVRRVVDAYPYVFFIHYLGFECSLAFLT